MPEMDAGTVEVDSVTATAENKKHLFIWDFEEFKIESSWILLDNYTNEITVRFESPFKAVPKVALTHPSWLRHFSADKKGFVIRVRENWGINGLLYNAVGGAGEWSLMEVIEKIQGEIKGDTTKKATIAAVGGAVAGAAGGHI